MNGSRKITPQHEKKYWSSNRQFYVQGVSGRWRIYAANGDIAIQDYFKSLYVAQNKMIGLKVES